MEARFFLILGLTFAWFLFDGYASASEPYFIYNEEEMGNLTCFNYNNPSLSDYQRMFPDGVVEHYARKRALSKCFEDIGCFSNDPEFFHVLKRPINLLPNDREKINTRFLLYTRKNIKQYHVLKAKNAKSVETSDFNPEAETKIIIHGYIDNQLFGEWMRIMKDEFLMHGDYNIILVDWSGGNGLPYTQATSNTRVVGAEIAFLVNYLKDNYKLQPEKVHILGHSLGSHVAGYAGERIERLRRITAMDPAEPYFQGMPPKVRIDPSDAQFVDVIHTDSKSIFKLGFGMSELVGHVDFFPNDGNDHPGCERVTSGLISIVIGGLAEGARRFIACNHQRSIDFVTDSINNLQCSTVGFTCKDYASFKSGACFECGGNSEKCATMGLKAIDYEPKLVHQSDDTTKAVKLYFLTSDKSPFCLFHYHVSLKLRKGEGISRTGELYLTIKGEKNENKFQLGDDKMNLKPGATYKFLVTTKKDLGAIESIIFGWKTKKLSIITTHTIFLDWIKVMPMNVENQRIQTSSSEEFCQAALNPIASGRDVSIFPVDAC